MLRLNNRKYLVYNSKFGNFRTRNNFLSVRPCRGYDQEFVDK